MAAIAVDQRIRVVATEPDDDDPAYQRTLRAAVNGQPDAIRMIAAEFVPQVTRFARRRQLADPEGFANGVLFDALRNLDVDRSPSRRQFAAFLWSVARNRSIDEGRRAKARPRSTHLWHEVSDPGAVDAEARVENQLVVEELLSSLKPDQRHVVELRFLEQLSLQETADRIGRNINSVKVLQHRGINALRARCSRPTSSVSWCQPV